MNSYGYHGTGIRVLTLNVLATTDDFMSVDRDGRLWMAQKKNLLYFSYKIACAVFPSSLSAEINFIKYDPLLWWRNHVSICLYHILNQQASTCAFLLRYLPRLRPWGRGILHERLHWQMYISKANFKLNWFNYNS